MKFKYLGLFPILLIIGCASSITTTSGIQGVNYGSSYQEIKDALGKQNFIIIEEKDTGTGYLKVTAEGSAEGTRYGEFWKTNCQQVAFLFSASSKVDVFQQGPCQQKIK